MGNNKTYNHRIFNEISADQAIEMIRDEKQSNVYYFSVNENAVKPVHNHVIRIVEIDQTRYFEMIDASEFKSKIDKQPIDDPEFRLYIDTWIKRNFSNLFSSGE